MAVLTSGSPSVPAWASRGDHRRTLDPPSTPAATSKPQPFRWTGTCSFSQVTMPTPNCSGGLDLYVSRRHNKRDDFGWRTPTNLGSGVNSPFTDSGPAVFEDDETGSFTLYFSSDRDSPGTEHIYASTLQEDETFGTGIARGGTQLFFT